MSPTSYQLLYSAVLRIAKVRIIFESANFFKLFLFLSEETARRQPSPDSGFRTQPPYPRKARMPAMSSLEKVRCSPEARFLMPTVPAAASSPPLIEMNGIALRSA